MHILQWLGLSLLLHAAYSTVHYRGLLKAMPAATAAQLPLPPFDVYAEAMAAFLFCAAGSIIGAPALRKVRAVSDSANKTLDDVLTNPDFMTFNHRGVALRRRLDAINKIQ